MPSEATTSPRPVRSLLGRAMLLAIVVTLVSGSLLALPTFWAEAVTGQRAGQHARHWVDCLFTAAAALTGTGLAVVEVGQQFNRSGQLFILALMQIGGFGSLILGSVLAWRFRAAAGWQSESDHRYAERPVRVLGALCLFAIVVQLVGAAGLYRMWDADSDPHFAAAVRDAELVASTYPDLLSTEAEARTLASVFHAVSAFSNAGLTLPRDGLVRYAAQVPVYVCLVPLMLLGCLGGPVLFDLWRRFVRRQKGPLSPETRLTVLGLAATIVLGGGLLYLSESSRAYQLRYPRDTTPGRLQVAAPATRAAIVFSADDSERVQAERLHTMAPAPRAAGAVFHAVSAVSGGMRSVRLDESSLSSAGRTVLLLAMLIGGGLGGTAGGLRVVVVLLLLACVLRPGRLRVGDSPIRAAAAIAAGLIAVIALTAFVLIYRDVGSAEASLFEAVSATCNVGLSTGLTRQLAVESRVLLTLAMLAGRVLPLAMLFTWLPRRGDVQPVSVPEPAPTLTPAPEPSPSAEPAH